MSPVLSAHGLTVGFGGASEPSLRGLNLELQRGMAVGLVGASGSGKSLLARALLGLLPAGAKRLAGTVRFEQQALESERAFARVRGIRVAYVFQDAAASLHPLQRVGAQLLECVAVHKLVRGAMARRARVTSALAEVGLDSDAHILRAFPHQLSGGQRQRVMLALTLLPNPSVLIADEPTSALDAVLARRICALLAELVRARGLALLLISHDLPRVAEICAQMHVLERGSLVESGTSQSLLMRPQHPATQRLSAALHATRPPPETAKAGASQLSASALSVSYRRAWRWPWRRPPDAALSAIDLLLTAGLRLGVVGSSGSGKSTLARALLGLLPQLQGQVCWFGENFLQLSERRQRALRPRVQLVFQDPFRSLDPLQRVDRMLAEALSHSPRGKISSALDRGQRAHQLLLAVGLDSEALDRYPSQFSGGQRQRLAIARALATDPDVLICDEATSALDSATQNQVLDLLDQLARERGIALLFIAHDLLAVARLCQQVMVLEQGRVVEFGDAAACIAAPQSNALRELVEALPVSLRQRLS